MYFLDSYNILIEHYDCIYHTSLVIKNKIISLVRHRWHDITRDNSEPLKKQ